MTVKIKIREEKSIGFPVWKLRVTQTLTKKTPHRVTFKYFDNHKEAINFISDDDLMKDLVKTEFQADNKIQVSAGKSTNNNPESKTKGEQR
jgi:hypothetical protein